MEFKHTQLDNGLNIIAEITPTAKSLAMGFFVRTGSRDETPDIAGVSHYLEHMMFKGTPKRTALEVNREFDQLGASYNAFTSEENTVYYGAVLPEFQDRLLDLLGDLMRPSLRQEDFDMEKNVILDEIARYEDQPSFRVYEKLMGTYFQGHPLANNVLGSPDSITALTRDQMQWYFDQRYSPGNVTLVGVGNLDFDAFVDKAAQMCSHWTPFNVSRETGDWRGAPGRNVIVDKAVTRQHIAMMSPAPAGQSKDRFSAHLFSHILGDHSGSRLYYALIETAIADEASMSYDLLDGTGGFITFISTAPERATEAVDIAISEYQKFIDDGFTDAELQAAKNKIASAATLKGELPMGRLTAVGFDWVYRNEYIPLAEQIETLFATTAEDIMDLGQRFDPTQVTILGLGPAEKI